MVYSDHIATGDLAQNMAAMQQTHSRLFIWTRSSPDKLSLQWALLGHPCDLQQICHPKPPPLQILCFGYKLNFMFRV